MGFRELPSMQASFTCGSPHKKATVGRGTLSRDLGALCCPLLGRTQLCVQAAVPNPLKSHVFSCPCFPGRDWPNSCQCSKLRASLRITWVYAKDQGWGMCSQPILEYSGSVNRVFLISLGGCQDCGFVTQVIACGRLQKCRVN